jgi:hypothetical protein
MRSRRVLPALLLAAALLGCGGAVRATDAGVASLDGGGAPLPTFALVDVNPASPTSMKRVSPQDYDGRVSAWYFGHSS